MHQATDSYIHFMVSLKKLFIFNNVMQCNVRTSSEQISIIYYIKYSIISSLLPMLLTLGVYECRLFIVKS